MPHLRPLLLPLAALAIAAGATAPGALAKGPKGPTKATIQKYTVTFSETRTVSWDEPAFSAYEDCSYKTFDEGHGREVAELSSSAPAKMVVFQNAYNPIIQQRFGTWSIGSAGSDARVTGRVDRQASTRTWYEGGACGEAPPAPAPEPGDCGVRKPSYNLNVSVTNGKVLVNLVRRGKLLDDPTSYRTCDLKFPDSMPQDLQPEPKKVSTARFLKPGGGITVKFHKRYEELAPAGARPWTRSGELTWKVTFTPKGR